MGLTETIKPDRQTLRQRLSLLELLSATKNILLFPNNIGSPHIFQQEDNICRVEETVYFIFNVACSINKPETVK